MEEYVPGVPEGIFEDSRVVFELVLTELASEESAAWTHAELEEHLAVQGRELLRTMLQDHLHLRAVRERRLDAVEGTDEVVRRRVEPAHRRALLTVFGEVVVERIAYRATGAGNLHPADAALNLPVEKHSHGLRRLAALEAARGSFADARAALVRGCGSGLGKRQLEALAHRSAVDIDTFYDQQRPGECGEEVLLVMTVDAKGVVMLPEALRECTARNARAKAAVGGRKLAGRLSAGEKRGRRRMAEVGAVHDAVPAPRLACDILPRTGEDRQDKTAGPITAGKWLTASVAAPTAEVIAAVFDEAERRDPGHRRTWLMLADGARYQLDLIHAEARRRNVTVHIVCDFVHVLEYLWKAAWCFFPQGDPAAEHWVAGQARKILQGKAGTVAAAIRRKATAAHLSATRRKGAEACARYLHAKKPYLEYGKALAAGWPIATGVIEGACRHLVKDRMDITGARWSLDGAEAVLKLRALISNGDFEAYWRYHLTREHLRNHLVRYRGELTLAA